MVFDYGTILWYHVHTEGGKDEQKAPQDISGTI